MRQYKPIYEGVPPILTSMFGESPRTETIKDMLQYTFCPYFSYSSLSFGWMTLCVFVFCCCFWFDSITKSDEFLKTSQKSLFHLGEHYPYYVIRQYQYFRLLTSLVLFRNFWHVFLTLLSILSLGSYIQEILGGKKLFLLVILSGVAGQIFGSLFRQQASVEGSTPISGLTGFLIGILIMNWSKWEKYSNQRFHMLVFLMFMVTVIWYSGFIYRNINTYSQVGALVYGFIISLVENPENEGMVRTPCLKAMHILLFLFLAISIAALVLSYFFLLQPLRLNV